MHIRSNLVEESENRDENADQSHDNSGLESLLDSDLSDAETVDLNSDDGPVSRLDPDNNSTREDDDDEDMFADSDESTMEMVVTQYRKKKDLANKTENAQTEAVESVETVLASTQVRKHMKIQRLF